jgi:hypothetical protein
LLAPTPSRLGGVLGDAKRPRAMAASFDWAGLVTAATPWVELAVREIAKEEPAGAGEMPKPKRKPKRQAAKEEREGPKAEKKIAVERKAPAQPKPRKATVMDQARVVLKVLAVIPSITGETYADHDALVTHTLTEIRDID